MWLKKKKTEINKNRKNHNLKSSIIFKKRGGDILKNMKLSRRVHMLVDRGRITTGWNYRIYIYYTKKKKSRILSL